MAIHGKKYRAIAAKAPAEAVDLDQALDFLKSSPAAKFDESVELSLRLGVDPKKVEQGIRGTVVLPNGTGKKIRVLVFASGSAADAAKAAGADFVGNEDLIEKVKGGWTEFDVAIATPEAMKEVRKLGKVLGPRGLMPNPKTGTVTDDTAAAVQQSKAGKVEYRMDRNGNLGVPVGKLSFAKDKLAENIDVLLNALRGDKPPGTKGLFFRTCTVSTTMGVGVRVNVKE
jgi:large subunit ribosomal protein L1